MAAFSFHIYNRSNVVSAAQVTAMLRAASTVLTTFCSRWSLAVPSIVNHGSALPPVPLPPLSVTQSHFTGTYPPRNQYVIVFVNTASDVPGAGGFHTLVGTDTVAGYVLCRTIMDIDSNRQSSASDKGIFVPGGARAITGSAGFFDCPAISISMALTHEMLEMVVNPYLNVYWYNYRDEQLYIGEVGDPVNFTSQRIVVGGGQAVHVSAYIVPAWHDPDSTDRVFDNARVLSAPFEGGDGLTAIEAERLDAVSAVRDMGDTPLHARKMRIMHAVRSATPRAAPRAALDIDAPGEAEEVGEAGKVEDTKKRCVVL